MLIEIIPKELEVIQNSLNEVTSGIHEEYLSDLVKANNSKIISVLNFFNNLEENPKNISLSIGIIVVICISLENILNEFDNESEMHARIGENINFVSSLKNKYFTLLKENNVNSSDYQSLIDSVVESNKKSSYWENIK